MTTGGGDTRTRSSIFWAMVFSRGDRRIGSASTSSTSARPFPTKRGNRSARRFEAGICIYAVTRPSKICRGCSIQRSVAGCNITGGIIARRCIPICVNWTARWPIGRIGNTKSCAVIYGGRHIGLRAFPGVIRSCSLTGRWACGVAPWREPYELRGSSTVLREPRGEIPRGYSPCGASETDGHGDHRVHESRLEGKFQWEINREKTRVVDLREEGASLDFLGYTFRYDRDLKGRDQRYLNVFPSKKAVQRERAKLHEMTDSRQCFKPISTLIGEL